MPELNAHVDALMSCHPLSGSLDFEGKVNSPTDAVVRQVQIPVLWPHQFDHHSRTVEPKYDTLSLTEFVASTSAILEFPELSPIERQVCTQHLRLVMAFARS